MSADPFDILGLPARFDLSEAEINQAYLTRANRSHPDVAKTVEAEEEAAKLNSAAGTLKDPEQRANALLSRLGGPSKDQDRSLPAGFLAEMMELRDTIDSELRSDAHAARSRWRSWSSARRAEYAEQVTRMFASLPLNDNKTNLRDIRAVLNSWRYIERLAEQLEPDHDPSRSGHA